MKRCNSGLVFFLLILFGGLGLSAQTVKRLTLEDCIRLGLEKNPQIKIAEAQIEGARGKEISVRANLIPKVTATGSAVTSNMLPNLKTGEPQLMPTTFPFANTQMDPLPPDHIHFIAFPGFEFTSDREGEIYIGKVEATWPIFTGGRIWNGYQAAQLEHKVQEKELIKQKLELIYQIKQAFYGALLAKEMVEVMDQSLATMSAHYRQVQDLYAEGMVSNLDLLQVEAKLASLKPQQIEVHNGLKLARLGLANILSLELDEPPEVVGELKYEPRGPADPEAYFELGLKDRPEIQTMDLREEQTKRMLKIARAGYIPTVALFANYQWNRGQLMPPNEDEWIEGYQAGVAVTIPIFDGLATQGEIKSARSQIKQIEAGKRALALGIETEVRSALLTLNATEEKVEAGRISVGSAEKSYQAAKDRYAVGMANNLDVMDAEVSLIQARAQYLQAVFDHELARANLEKAIGRMSAGYEIY